VSNAADVGVASSDDEPAGGLPRLSDEELDAMPVEECVVRWAILPPEDGAGAAAAVESVAVPVVAAELAASAPPAASVLAAVDGDGQAVDAEVVPGGGVGDAELPSATPPYVCGKRPPPQAFDFVEGALRLRAGWLSRHFNSFEIDLLKVCR
jgi:hypothetical protein